MKHYRILEKKKILETNKEKEYVIQYLKKLFFGLFYWKKLDKNLIYNRYEDAFNVVKSLIIKTDYENIEFGYHYIDAYKIFKEPKTTKVLEPVIEQPKIEEKIELVKEKFIPTPKVIRNKRQPSSSDKKVNKSTFIPKQ
jgi:hypothetical protein